MPEDKESQEYREREERRRRFAQAMTREAFGRHYWDEDRARELRRAVERRKDGEAPAPRRKM